MEFIEKMQDLMNLNTELVSNNIQEEMKQQFSCRVIQLQMAKTRRVTLEEMLAIQEQNRLLQQIKDAISSRKNFKSETTKEMEETFQTTKDCNSSISFLKTDRTERNRSFLLEPQNKSQYSIVISPKNKISRRGSLTSFDIEAVLGCVRKNFGFQTSETLRSMLDSSTEHQNNKYKNLYEREKSKHQAAELGRRQLAVKIQMLLSRIEQLQKDVYIQQSEKKNLSKTVKTIESKQSKLVKLQTKLLIKQKLLIQEQKHLETLKASIQRQRQILEKESVTIDNKNCEVLSALRMSLQKRRKSCKQYEIKLQDQFSFMSQFINRIEEGDSCIF